MHATEREREILRLLKDQGFVSFQELDRRLPASAATIRRDLERLDREGRIARVRGGAQLPGGVQELPHLEGTPFHVNIDRHGAEKAAIGSAAAALCQPGESVIIDGGTTTLQMCQHLEPLGLQVLTNSLHIVQALLPQPRTRVSVPAGTIFREQDIILSPFDEDGTGNFRASRMFMGASGISRHGLMQVDTLLMQAERRLVERADELIVLVDSSKFASAAGHALFPLSRIHALITDMGASSNDIAMLESAGIKVIVVDPARNSR